MRIFITFIIFMWIMLFISGATGTAFLGKDKATVWCDSLGKLPSDFTMMFAPGDIMTCKFRGLLPNKAGK
jgi:hypothetical protein